MPAATAKKRRRVLDSEGVELAGAALFAVGIAVWFAPAIAAHGGPAGPVLAAEMMVLAGLMLAGALTGMVLRIIRRRRLSRSSV